MEKAEGGTCVVMGQIELHKYGVTAYIEGSISPDGAVTFTVVDIMKCEFDDIPTWVLGASFVGTLTDNTCAGTWSAEVTLPLPEVFTPGTTLFHPKMHAENLGLSADLKTVSQRPGFGHAELTAISVLGETNTNIDEPQPIRSGIRLFEFR